MNTHQDLSTQSGGKAPLPALQLHQQEAAPSAALALQQQSVPSALPARHQSAQQPTAPLVSGSDAQQYSRCIGAPIVGPVPLQLKQRALSASRDKLCWFYVDPEVHIMSYRSSLWLRSLASGSEMDQLGLLFVLSSLFVQGAFPICSSNLGCRGGRRGPAASCNSASGWHAWAVTPCWQRSTMSFGRCLCGGWAPSHEIYIPL